MGGVCQYHLQYRQACLILGMCASLVSRNYIVNVQLNVESLLILINNKMNVSMFKESLDVESILNGSLHVESMLKECLNVESMLKECINVETMLNECLNFQLMLNACLLERMSQC